MERGSGILMHISSFPTNYGIGTMGSEAYRFVDFLQKSGQKYWQILPIGPTSYGDSPYQSFSTFAGNPYFIDLDKLREDGALKFEEYADLDWGSDREKVDYEKIFKNRFKVLQIAYSRDRQRKREEIHKFRVENSYWIENYAMFMALKFANNLSMYRTWGDDLVMRKPEAIIEVYNKLDQEIDFWVYVQFLFYKQWNALKEYANKQGIKIIGDIPIYVAEDSADAWSHNEVLMLEADGTPIKVAGCPPDGYAPKGQLWGNPLYNWEVHRNTGFDWWIHRIEHCFRLYDVVRIDHFRGFDEYYAIPYGDKTAENGWWEKGPGIDLFRAISARLGQRDIIAEDLGYMTDSVKALVEESGYPNMKVIEFAFDERDTGNASDYLPHNYPENCVVYTGTHDNETLLSWFRDISPLERRQVREYLNDFHSSEQEICQNLICLVMRSVAKLCVIPMQDYLYLDNSARMNQPSTLGKNWKWRLVPGQFTEALQKEMKALAKRYGR